MAQRTGGPEMKARTLAKLIKERPWLWAIKPKWNPATTEAKVERKSMDEFIVFMHEAWPQVMSGEAKLWLYIRYRRETGWGSWACDAEQVLPFVPHPKFPGNWVKAFFGSLCCVCGDGNDEAYTGGFVDEIVFVHPTPPLNWQRDDILIIPKPWDKLDFKSMLFEHGGWIEWRFKETPTSAMEAKQ